MITAYILLSIFIAWIWIDYYRMIDIYDTEKLTHLAIAFVLGGIGPLLTYGFTETVLDFFGVTFYNFYLHSFYQSVIEVGLVEELSKFAAFLLIYRIFKKEITEPIDYLAYMCCSALGFAALENVLYFSTEGAQIISGRSILSTVGHMFDSSLIAYGIIRYRYHPSKPSRRSIAGFIGLAALAHGFYNFVIVAIPAPFNFMFLLFYFLLTISLFAVILNNALNNSRYFSYKKVIDSQRILKRLGIAYAGVFVLQAALVGVDKGFWEAALTFNSDLCSSGFVLAIASIRLTRFKLIEGRWFPLKLELPFKMDYSYDPGPMNRGMHLQVKGDSYNETYIHRYYEEHFRLAPFGRRSKYLPHAQGAFIERKLFLKNDTAFYLTRIYHSEAKEDFTYYLIKPKTRGESFTDKGSPILALLKLEENAEIEDTSKTVNDFKFLGWTAALPAKA